MGEGCRSGGANNILEVFKVFDGHFFVGYSVGKICFILIVLFMLRTMLNMAFD